MKRKWWIFAIAAVTAVLILAGVFWDAILIHAVPNVMLSKALANTVSQLQARMTDNPLLLIAGNADLQGCNSIALCLDTDHLLLGKVRYNMDLQVEATPRRIYAEGVVASKAGELDLAVYLDSDFAAITSDSLLDGKFYGITYDSFPEDVRSFPILPLLVGNTTLKAWEQSVTKMDEMMEAPDEIPNVSSADLRMVLGGILSLKPVVSKDSLMLSGEKREVYRLDFSVPGRKLAAVAGEYRINMSQGLRKMIDKLGEDPNSSVNASFYICEKTVVKATVDFEAGETQLQGELLMGLIPAKDSQLALISRGEDSLDKWSVKVDTTREDEIYSEKIEVIHIKNGVQERNVMDYTWNTATGQLKLRKEGEGDPVLLTMKQVEDGLIISTDQFEDMMTLLGAEEKEGDSHCQMKISKGASVSVPEYKNLDQWSGDDLLTLLGGFGALFGLKTR